MELLRSIAQPNKDEYPAYSEMYMAMVPSNGQVLNVLKQNAVDLKEMIYSHTESDLIYSYAPGKWTIKEILVHLIDDERIFSYRALRYARNDQTLLPGFDQDEYVKFSQAHDRTLDSIFSEYDAVRNSTIQLFQNLPEDAWLRMGTVVDTDGHLNKRTVRATLYHITGHEMHHIRIIKEKYLKRSSL